MSEPSLRTTVASALAKADGYAPSDNPEAWRDNRLRYEQLADAALRVIHSQRDAIATAVAPLIDQMIECGPLSAENFQRGVDGAADAVLAMLDGTVGE